jgi:hypothetical protein
MPNRDLSSGAPFAPARGARHDRERWCRALASEPNSGALFTRETRPYADRLFVAERDSGRRVGMDGRMTERWSQVSVRHGDAGRT